MMILAYISFGLLSSVSGKTVVISLSNDYVNKPGTATVTCKVVDDVIHDTVEIDKDGIHALRCPCPPVPCFSTVAAYSAVQNKTAGTTTMTISATDISRDTGNWTCLHGSTSSKAASLTVGTPVSVTKMNELNTNAVIETSCIFPYAGVQVSCSVGGTDINCLYIISSSATCGDLKERVLTITIYLDLFKGSASGLLTVHINNRFTAVSKTGNHNYTFTAATKTGVTTDDSAHEVILLSAIFSGIICIGLIVILVKIGLKSAPCFKKPSALGSRKFVLGFGFSIIIISYIVCIAILLTIGDLSALELKQGRGLALGIPIFVGCIIAIVILVKKDLKLPPAPDSRKYILGFGFIIMVISYIMFIVIFVRIGDLSALELVLEIGLGFVIPYFGFIIVMVILVKKVNILAKFELQKTKLVVSEVTITASIDELFISCVQWIGPDGNILTSNGKYNIKYNRDTGISTLQISALATSDSGLYICRTEGGFSSKDSVTISVNDCKLPTASVSQDTRQGEPAGIEMKAQSMLPAGSVQDESVGHEVDAETSYSDGSVQDESVGHEVDAETSYSDDSVVNGKVEPAEHEEEIQPFLSWDLELAQAPSIAKLIHSREQEKSLMGLNLQMISCKN